MAGEVTTEPVDPMSAIVASHLARMEQIANEGRTSTQLSCLALIGMISKNVGLRNAMFDKALGSIGTTDSTV